MFSKSVTIKFVISFLTSEFMSKWRLLELGDSIFFFGPTQKACGTTYVVKKKLRATYVPKAHEATCFIYYIYIYIYSFIIVT